MNLTTIAIIGIVALLICLVLGMDIGMCMFGVGLIGFFAVTGFKGAVGLLSQNPMTVASKFEFCVVPLFILMGNAAFASGMSDGLYNAGHKWLNWVPGSLSCATIAACAGFGAIGGSTPATAATMSVVAIPEMRKYGYDDRLSTGSVAVGSTLGIMIPPSTPFIIYGIMAEESIGRLFAAGVFPGLLLAFLCIVTIAILVKRNPRLAGPDVHITWKERFASLKGLIWVVVLFGFVFGGMFGGLFTINEAAACGAALSIVIMAINRKLSWKNFKSVMINTIKTTSMCYLILIGADLFSKFLAVTQLPMNLAKWVGSIEVSRYVILLVVVIIYAIMGCFMDTMAMITLTVPIFLPIMKTLGFNGIWFGVIIVLVMELGFVTPPVGLAAYVVGGVFKDIPLTTIFKGCFPFIPAILISIILVTVFPQIALWLPGVIYG